MGGTSGPRLQALTSVCLTAVPWGGESPKEESGQFADSRQRHAGQKQGCGEDPQVTKKHVERCPPSSAIREIETKTPRCSLTPTRIAKLNMRLSAGDEVETLKAFCTAGGDGKQCRTRKTRLGVPQPRKTPPHDPAVPHPPHVFPQERRPCIEELTAVGFLFFFF